MASYFVKSIDLFGFSVTKTSSFKTWNFPDFQRFNPTHPLLELFAIELKPNKSEKIKRADRKNIPDIRRLRKVRKKHPSHFVQQVFEIDLTPGINDQKRATTIAQ
jgi:hypothetical protein